LAEEECTLANAYARNAWQNSESRIDMRLYGSGVGELLGLLRSGRITMWKDVQRIWK
jgi:hypothetical protein